MSILKLTEPGSSLTLDVAGVGIVKGDLGEQVKFETIGGDILFVPSASVTRQLDRCGVAEIADLRGKAIHFSRSDTLGKNGKPYWNLDKAKASDTRTNGAPSSNGTPKSTAPVASALSQNEHNVGWLPGDEVETGGPPTEASGFDVMVERYTECFNEAAGFAQRIHKLGLPVDLSGISSIAATLFIARKDARV
jgi:hypothetical protein